MGGNRERGPFERRKRTRAHNRGKLREGGGMRGEEEKRSERKQHPETKKQTGWRK